MMYAPAIIGVRSKSIYTPSVDDAAMTLAAGMVRGVRRAMPVILGGRVIAWMRDSGRGYIEWRREFGLPNYGTIIGSVFGDAQHYKCYWYKKISYTAKSWRWIDLWGHAGSPVLGVYGGTAATAVRHSDNDQYCLAHGGNVSPAEKQLLTMYGYSHNTTPTSQQLMLYDRVIDYQNCAFPASGGGETINMDNTLTAQRYIGADDHGLQIMVTDSQDAATTPNGANITVSYTDQDGNAASVTGVTFCSTNSQATQVIAPADAALTTTSGKAFLDLATGDTGARAITSYGPNSSGVGATGKLVFVLCQPIALLPLPGAGLVMMQDLAHTVGGMPTILDGAHLSLLAWIKNGYTSNSHIMGGAEFGWN